MCATLGKTERRRLRGKKGASLSHNVGRGRDHAISTRMILPLRGETSFLGIKNFYIVQWFVDLQSLSLPTKILFFGI